MHTLVASYFSHLAENTHSTPLLQPPATESLIKGKVTVDPHNSLKPQQRCLFVLHKCILEEAGIPAIQPSRMKSLSCAAQT